MPQARAFARSSQPEQRIAQRYVVESEIARGGMGVVYKVRDQTSGALYALKRLRIDAQGQRAALLAGFEREYQVLASLDHPGIIRVFDYGVDGDEPYYTMEFVEGRDLRVLSPMPWRDACRQLREVASALSLLHARRLIHRDLSPNNVKVTIRGQSKLLDFGALSDFGYSKWIMGTPPLIAPEMLSGGMLDQRTDLYALGALAYWLLTNRHAYPAPTIDELPTAWKRIPPAPSAYVRGIPGSLDAVVMSLLSANPLARPSSAAEVIANLNGIGELGPEHESERQRLARSFLAVPPFVGRDAQIDVLSAKLTEMMQGHGHAITLRGVSGSGRSRLLEEAGVRAQIAGATVLRVDASMDPRSYGTSRALVTRLFEALPVLAVKEGQRFRGAIEMLGGDLLERLGDEARSAPATAHERGLQAVDLAELFFSVTRTKPLVLQVDNADLADDVSLGLLASLAREAPAHRLSLMVIERIDAAETPSLGIRALRELSSALTLPQLSSSETLALLRSMFGDAPNVARFTEWLHGRTAGNPLLTVELARQLVDRGEVRYQEGLWQLPSSQPETQYSALLGDLLSARLARLSTEATALAYCLGVSRVEATFALCAQLGRGRVERGVRGLLDELVQADVLQAEQGVYRFSSAALREVLLAHASDGELEASHQRVGRALLSSPDVGPVEQIEAGWHLIRGGHELEGADLIRAVLKDGVVTRRLNANMVRIGPPVEAALAVYKHHLRPTHLWLPLLCALAHAGYFEDPRYDDAYASEALELMAEFTGLRLARRLRFLGKYLALVLGLAVGLWNWLWVPRRERPFSYKHTLVHLFGTVTSSVVVATLKLDGDRAARVADVIEPFVALPQHSTPRSIYRFCHSMQHVAREQQADAFHAFDAIVKDFDSGRGLRLVPTDVRVVFVAGAHFARGAFAVFRDDGALALQSAQVLESCGLRLFAMMGSQLRYLYHLYRGELSEAAPHRARVELHAAHFGSAWQVELWEAPALIPLQFVSEDPANILRLAHQIRQNAQSVPSLRRYAFLSALSSSILRNDPGLRALLSRGERVVEAEVPRSFIGWSTVIAVIARCYNQLGEHAYARTWCDRALRSLTDDDRESVALFLMVDLQTALADAGLRNFDAAFARLDGLITRFREGKNPLTLGRLHEVRARIAWLSGRLEDYEQSLAEVERWFGQSSMPALVAKCERLAELMRPAETTRGRVLPASRGALDALSDLSDLDTEV